MKSDLTVTAVFSLYGALPGVFTIGKGNDGKEGTDDDVKVQFPKGNLYVDDDYKWRFENNQYDFRTYDNEGSCINGVYNESNGTPFGNWGLFGWVGESSNYFDILQYGVSLSKKTEDYGNKAGESLKSDWGIAYCSSNDIADLGTWRTLSVSEWNFLISSRKEANSKVGYATVGDVHGIIIIPDGTFRDPEKNTSGGGTGKKFVPDVKNGWNQNYYSIESWEAM